MADYTWVWLIIRLEHVQEYINKGPEVAEKLTNSYVALNSLLSKPLETQTIKDSKELKKATVTTLRPTYLCLQCATICSDEDRDAHAKAKKHTWCRYRFSIWPALC
jgi:hypothetical protein